MEEAISKNFIEQIIEEDLKEGKYEKIVTRFPPEPNGYLHIGHAKSILLNYGLAKEYGGDFHFRFDDTNPTKEKTEYVDSIKEDVEWLGADYDQTIYFASNYFDRMYECAEFLIKKGKAYVCDLTPEEIREYRGTLTEPGKNSPYRDRTPEENLALFRAMKNGEFEDGSKVLRAKIDMTSGNMNMRDPILYRIARMEHHNTGDDWCIYPMYDFAHPLEDAFEGVTHSICTLEFEDHRPLYDWVVRECEFAHPPKQIEFAKLYLTNVVTGKRYIKKLVDEGIVDGWDDPRLVTLSALRRRGYTPESIRRFMELVGVAKSHSSVDYAMLEYCIRDDLKLKKPRVSAVLDPIKLVITNYPEDQVEYMEVKNNQENEEMGTRKVPFCRELYIERDDFKIERPKKYFRLYPGNEVRLMNGYFVTCTDYVTDEDGNVTEVLCTYDPESRGGNSPDGRKVKGTIHWVAAPFAKKAEVRLYENIVDEEKGVYNEDGSVNLNPDSLIILKDCYVEPSLEEAAPGDSFQFVRQGYFCLDTKDTTKDHMVFNRIVSMKSSYQPK
ncbi:glutamine--tRNA ligase/YqeY domain fusion protein [Anaerostipes caccae]|uniref:glutamine--tRNA ligase/YqeY domain fusion protein n=1 Tax=Anaerostipes caccae TaxID=105841 RepID=UPI0038D51357